MIRNMFFNMGDEGDYDLKLSHPSPSPSYSNQKVVAP